MNHEQRLQARIKRLERVIEISRSLNSTLSLPPLLHQLIEAARGLTNTEASSIMLLDRQTGELHFEAATGVRSTEIRSIVVPTEGSVAGWVVRHGEPVVIQDTSEDPRLYREIEEEIQFYTHSMVAVPLAVKGRVIGVLEAVNKQDGECFSDEDVEILTILADQAAVAIENAFLFQQSDLISEIVHEMRTPLTSISGYAEMIQREDVSGDARCSFARTIQRQAARLADLTNAFLDLARLESGRVFMNCEPFRLAPVVQETIELLRPQAEEKAIALRSDVAQDLPALVGDPQWIHQALVNLVGNGVKYCDPGDEVRVLAQESGRELLVCVADTGPGIPPEAQEHVFEKFYRVAWSEKRAKGTGLGLAITRRIVEEHGGRIWVESAVGEGANFCFTLPL